MKEEKLYEVCAPGSDRKIIVRAANSAQAKRRACKIWGCKAKDPWTGVTSLRAKKIDEDEEGF